MDHLERSILEWTSTAISVGGSYWIGNRDLRHRHLGFLVLLVSNVLWVVWGVPTHAWGFVTMQSAYLALNARGFLLTLAERRQPPGQAVTPRAQGS